MGYKLYAVTRHNGQWGISVHNAPFLSCDSYEEALDVATNAAAILRSAYTGEARDPSSRGKFSTVDQSPGRRR